MPLVPIPLLIIDTNVLLDIWLLRDGEQAALLVELAEQRRVDLIVPEYVLREFRGTALRWIRGEQERTKEIRRSANEWRRCFELGAAADDMRKAAADIDARLVRFAAQMDGVISRLGKAAHVPSHTSAIHLRGELRYLEGRPPDRPDAGLSDCRIYEALLEIARQEATSSRRKVFVTRDAGFDSPELVSELAALGFEIHKEPGRLYGELK